MDVPAFMALDILGVICWIFGALRPRQSVVVRIICIPAVIVLAVYFLMLLAQAQPELWTGTAQAGPGAVYLIAFGVFALIGKLPKPNDDQDHGGALSA